MTSGGAAPKRMGRNFERDCKAELEAAGWWVTQTPPSNDGGLDLLAIRHGRILAVQCKRAGYMTPAERLELSAFRQFGMVPVMARPRRPPARGATLWLVLVDASAMGPGSSHRSWVDYDIVKGEVRV